MAAEAEGGGTWPQATGHQEPPAVEEAGRALPHSLQRERGPAHTVTSDWPPGLRGYISLVGSPPVCAICNGGHRKLFQGLRWKTEKVSVVD